MKRRVLLCLFCALALLLSACALSPFDNEYVLEYTYVAPSPATESETDESRVSEAEDIRALLRDMVAEGETQLRFAFRPEYRGDAGDDLGAACWQLRTQDALCAYCVENIVYEVNRGVNFTEAVVRVSYSEAAGDVTNIVRLRYAADARVPICEALRAGKTRLVLLIERSSYTEEGMERYVRELYEEQPGLCPRQPDVAVRQFSGEETQRLYELSIDYGLGEEEFAARMAALSALEPFTGIETSRLSEPERALLACRVLCEKAQYREDAPSGIYDALVAGEADSRGLADAYTQLCRELGVPCQLVTGQKDWKEHYWNIVCLEGEYYHVDVSACIDGGLEAGFLMDDGFAWGAYRWDYFSYPTCEGTLEYPWE